MASIGDPVSSISYADIGFPGGSSGVIFDPHGSYVLAARAGRITACDTKTGKVQWHVNDSAGTVVAGGACSPDGKSIALLWGIFTKLCLRVLDLATGADRFGRGPWVNRSPVFSPNGQLLAYSLWDLSASPTTQKVTVVPGGSGTPDLWTAPGFGGLFAKFGDPPNSAISPIWFSPDSRLLAIRREGPARIELFDAVTGDPTPLTLPLGQGRSIFTPDSRYVVTFNSQAAQWPVVRFTDAETGLIAWETQLVGGSTPPTSQAGGIFSTDAGKVAVFTDSGTAVFDLPASAPQSHPLFPPDPTASPHAFSPGGNFLSLVQVLSDADWRIRIVEAGSGNTVWQRNFPGSFDSVFSPDGRYFAVWGSGTSIDVFTAGDPYQPSDPVFAGRISSQAQFDAPVTDVGITGGSTPVAVAVSAPSGADPVVSMLGVDDGHPVRTVPVRGLILATVCGPSAAWVGVGSANGLLHILHTDSTGDWKAKHGGSVNAVATATSAQLIVTASSDLRVRVFTPDMAPGDDPNQRQPLWSTAKHPQSVIHVAVSADSRWVISGCADGNAYIFENTSDAGEHTAQHTIPSSSRIRTLAFGGTHLAAVGFDDGSAVVVDAATGDTYTLRHQSPVLSLSFNGDASLLASASAVPDALLRIWRLADFSPGDSSDAADPVDFRGPINRVAFSPIAPIVAAALTSGAVAILNTDSGNTIRLPFDDAVNNVQFSADGSLMIASTDHQVRIYSTT
jgi:WD40 repeat protein